jgi:antitoxin ParD1/3/4
MERMTITLTEDQAERIKAALAKGDYASHSEVIREALRDWELNRPLRKQALAELKGEIDKGLADARAGRVKSFDADAIIQQGKRRLAGRDARAIFGG